MKDSLVVFDSDFNQLGIISDFYNFEYQEEYYNNGTFKLICHFLPENVKLLQQGRFLHKTNMQTAFIIRHLIKDTEKKVIYAYGRTSLDLIAQRVMLSTQQINNAELAMFNIVNNNLRGLENVIVGTPNGYAEALNGQMSDYYLLDANKLIGMQVGIGQKMVFDRKAKKHIYQTYKGNDRSLTISFSDDLGGLDNIKLEINVANFKNVAVVKGAGEGDARLTEVVGIATGNNRFELPVDARDIQPEDGETEEQLRQRLSWRGIEKLSDHPILLKISVEVDETGFNKDYFLGDIVSIKSTELGLKFKARIISYIISEDQKGSILTINLSEYQF